MFTDKGQTLMSVELRIEIEGLTGPELEKRQQFNERVTQIETAIAGQLSQAESKFPDCRKLKIAAIRKFRDESEQRTLELLQERVSVAEERAEILESFEQAFQKCIDAAENERDKAIKDATKGLHKTGISAESNPVYKHDSNAAEIQFSHQVNKSQFVRDAKVNVQTAEDNMARLNTLRMQADTVIKRTVDDLQAFVRQLCK
jgi:dsDNA-specific endonuclease/ATPase MutS2